MRSRKRPDKSGNCALCGIYRKVLVRDRKIPGREGGKYTPDNIQWICANCHQDKTALEQSAAHKGRPKSAEQRAKMSAWQIGMPKSEATKAKIRATLTGYKHTAETRKKMSESGKGRVFSAEHRAKISAALKGRATRRGTHCPHGHAYAEHGRETSSGKIECRTCRNERKRAKRIAVR